MAGRMGEGVVGVVPALSEGQGRDPGVVAGAIATGVDDVAPAVGGRIDQPGAVVHEHQAQGDAPEHQGPAARARRRADPEQQAG